MGRPPVIPPEKKVRVVLAVLAGGVSVSEAARKEKVGEQSVHRWKADFVVAGKVGLIAGRLLRISLPFLIVADDRRGGGARQQHRRGGVGRVADCWVLCWSPLRLACGASGPYQVLDNSPAQLS